MKHKTKKNRNAENKFLDVFKVFFPTPYHTQRLLQNIQQTIAPKAQQNK